ncbi:MAG: hypothetical protein AAF446_01280 [Pseudomonadota bacterium]
MKRIRPKFQALFWLLILSPVSLLFSAQSQNPVSGDGYSNDRLTPVERAMEAEYPNLIGTAAAWMQQQSSPRLNSLALIPDLFQYTIEPDSWQLEAETDAGRAFIAQVAAILQAELIDEPSLFFLGVACEQRKMMDACRAAGLDSAIEHMHGGNIALLGLLASGNDDVLWQQIIHEGEHFYTYYREAIDGWQQALFATRAENQGLFSEADLASIAGIRGINAGFFAANLSPLMNHCVLAATAAASDLLVHCQRIAKNLRDSHSDLMTQIIGFSLSEQLAEAQGLFEAERLAEQNQASSDYYMCLHRFMPEYYGDAIYMRKWLNWIIKYGELEATERMAAELGVDCGQKPDFSSEHSLIE